ncbi:MAG: RAD55 family ATPase [Thermoguttaceae bacterium]
MRLSTGIEELDDKLGGGLIPGTMTVLVGSSGIGKTQLGIHFANGGNTQNESLGIILDLIARADSQGHAEYAKRIANWQLKSEEFASFDPKTFFDDAKFYEHYLQVISTQGKRVTKKDLDFDEWHNWQSEQAKNLSRTIAFLFGHFSHGVRRLVIDGIEPVEHQSDSMQFEILEYIYHQIVRKEPFWVARDLFRQHFRANEEAILTHSYNQEDIGCMVLYTSPESSLESMIEKPLESGDLLAGANTIIYLGKIRDGLRFRRALYISKHRGSACSDEIIPFEISESGMNLC